MGEYAYVAEGNDAVKIGTCESMYWLRFDQLDEITARSEYSLDPRDPRVWPGIRFRFPFPDEDGIPVGQHAEYERGLNIFDASLAELITQHKRVQFISNQHGGAGRGGWNVMLPCPLSPEARELEEDGTRIMRNGGRTGIDIQQQRVWGKGADAVLAVVVRCAGCGALVSFHTLAGAAPIVEACIARANEAENRDAAERWLTIAQRITAGYNAPPERIRNA